MAETVRSDSSPDTDRDFDPGAEQNVNEYDDEQTLEDEENMSNSESGGSELDNLQKEGDMPIEDLLAMYGYGGGGPPSGGPPNPDSQESRASSSEEEILSNQDLTLDKEEIARDLLKDDEDSNKETSVTDLLDSVDMDMPSETHRLLRSANSQSSDDDDSEDVDYQPAIIEDWKKTISVGSDYQAQIPSQLQKYGDAPAYENEDRLLWDPWKIEDKEVEVYLRDVQQQTLQGAQGVNAIPQGSHIRDDEQALYLLLQCGHNVEEACRRRKMQAVPPTDPMSLWSEEECRNFEMGLKAYGKDFYLIQQNKVRTRSVGELVQFYYLWKKTERHDAFTNKNRLEKKKYALHPGVTDYMDRFLDEQENPAPIPRERSSSPGIGSLMYGVGDHKRHSISDSLLPRTPTQVDIPHIIEMVQKVVHPQELEKLSSELHSAQAATVSLATATTTTSLPPLSSPPTSVLPSSSPEPADDGMAPLPASSVVLPTFTSSPPRVTSVPSPLPATEVSNNNSTTATVVPVVENCVSSDEISSDETKTVRASPSPARVITSIAGEKRPESRLMSDNSDQPSAKRLRVDNIDTSATSANGTKQTSPAIAEVAEKGSDISPFSNDNNVKAGTEDNSSIQHRTDVADLPEIHSESTEQINSVAVTINMNNTSVSKVLESKFSLPRESTSPPVTAE